MTSAFQPSAFQGYAFQVDPVTGYIYAVDQNDVATLMGTVTGGGEGIDMHDGGHKKFKKLQSRIEKVQQERDRLFAEMNDRRRMDLRKVIAPETIAKVKQVEVESEQEVASADVQKENVQKELDRLLLEQQYLLKSMVQKQAKAQFEAYMAKLEADYRQNIEDEEALLLLL